MHVEVAVFEKYILNVKIGQKIHFKVSEAFKDILNDESAFRRKINMRKRQSD